jgi:cold shock CspA family protein
MKGKIKKYFSYRGYGFIEVVESEKDIFFHLSNFPRNLVPNIGQDVEFELIETPKGKEAVKVRTIRSETKSSSDESESIEQIYTGKSDLGELDGVGPKYLELLEASGLQSVESLTKYTPEILLTILHETNEKQNITSRPPSRERIEEWIQSAKLEIDI